jgi:glycosyltransferase involved in cell wall biosynthesis
MIQSHAAVPDRFVGVFGFGNDDARVDLITQAVARVCDPDSLLLLIGQPGPSSAVGQKWSEAAREAGCSIEFTGETDLEAISDALSAASLVVFPDDGGPSPRRTTLAAALAYGKAIVALDGKETWDEFRLSHAVALVSPTIVCLAEEIRRLINDEALRVELGTRASRFYARRMSAEVVAAEFADILVRVSSEDQS